MFRHGERPAEHAWYLYDWGNSAFATVCMTAVLPPFVVSIVNGELGAPAGSVVWGWAAALGLAVGALLGPPLGAYADSRGRRLRLLAVFALGGAAATAGLAVVLPGSWKAAVVLYVVAATGFTGANVFYDGLLPSLGPASRWDSLSARGYAWGYAGGGLVLVVAAVLALSLRDAGVRVGFLVVAGWWAVFTVPVLRRVREPRVVGGGGAWTRLRSTFHEARRHPNVWRFLLAYWLYNDGIGTVIKLAGAYGAEIGLPLSGMLGALVLAQVVGIPATLAFSRMAARTGPKAAIMAALAGYVVIVGYAYLLESVWQFYLLAGMVGMIQGGAQALSRSLYARLVPSGREAEYFSFLDVSGRMAGVAGPVLFAVVAQLSGSGRGGILAIAGLFVAGGWLLRRVEVSQDGNDFVKAGV